MTAPEISDECADYIRQLESSLLDANNEISRLSESAAAALASCEAEVRRKVAAELDAEAEKCLAAARDVFQLAPTHDRQASAYRHAARIARGES